MSGIAINILSKSETYLMETALDTKLLVQLKNRFDLDRYQKHVLKHVDEIPTDIRDIPPLIKEKRRDLIYRFVAIIFLDHEGKVDIEQKGLKLWVKTHADRQGQDIPGEAEEIDRFEGHMGTAASW
jgi:chromatin segregation and condensation protein Rec8/ScpA/Scc1 (kleisin family)